MDVDEAWRHIDQQRADLAEFLDSLSDEQWATPSLCDGWTVRDVAVHLTHSAASWPRMAWQAVRAGFRFNDMVARAARDDTSTPAEVVTTLRGMVGGRRRPPGTAVVDPLMDVLVHGQDIAIALGVDRAMPVTPAVAAAERVWGMGFPLHASTRFHGLAFTATDAPFAVGEGSAVFGPIKDILLVLAGRRAGVAGLSGDTTALALALDHR
jgi:uncharacterized protein (TIGR03083 family)